MKNIIALEEEFSKWEQNEVNKLDFNWFVYFYEYGSCEGSGFAIWRKYDKYYYDYLGDCSCYGPTENISIADNGEFTFEQVKEIAEKDEYGKECIEFIIEEKMYE